MPASATPQAFSVVLLAGGRGQRMGGQDKGLVLWRARPMIAWLHQVVRPLTDDLIISCNRNQQAYAPYADRLVGDESADYPGPLAGIRAALQVARHPLLLVLPCDAPRVDRALVERLLALAEDRPVMAQRAGYWEPLFAVIPRRLLPSLEQAWQAGERSTQRWLRAHDPVALRCASEDPRLSNLNSPDLLG
ncbi:molybdenum cofactor guanylyltransferase MobA [Pseudomonas argentinensis]|uniref:Molybdenum cofactor guanylyltransferase n=1 Tax=Phytopseudomonas argentinensis TaxID=289370 RepID=A0A1I3GVV8_9GAMM|nr:molybdenum cofactor guanylyltransferase MobA [Pseudomonas argentinensis]KAB0548841.1 molybdenum cofactor guanylyltransferase MobA [Pseudomonas argentinensis]SFI27705.1 molybdenum cofactor guanylyltransferase [Pseudomonas argentinensis]